MLKAFATATSPQLILTVTCLRPSPKKSHSPKASHTPHYTSKASWPYNDTTVYKMATINKNTAKVYYALDEQMVAYHDKDDAHSRRQAEHRP